MHRPRRTLPRPHRDDVLIAAAGLLGGFLLWALNVSDALVWGGSHGALVLVPLAVMSVAELLRRIGQPWALLVACAALGGDLAAGSLLATVLMFTDVVYAAVLYGSPRTARRVPPLSVLVTVALTVVALAASRSTDALAAGLVSGLVFVVPAFSGAVVRNHRDTAAAERLRAEQTALLAETDRRQAVLAERARMARELHDVVAGHLSAITVQSTAALSLDTGSAPPEAAREALGVIRENGVQGLAEMRRLIGLLRDPAESATVAGPAVSPTLDGLDALLDRARAAAADGFSFALHDDRGPGPQGAAVELAAYRIVQESVTNALKHARPGPVTVRLSGDESGLTVRVTSRLPTGAQEPPRAPGAGAGLIGMRERVTLVGGELSAGPAGSGTDGGKLWEVRAVLPVTEGTS